MTESMEEGLLDRSSLRKESWQFHVTANVILSSSVAACGYFAYGFASGYPSPAQLGIMDELGLSIAEYSVFASIMTLGGMIGALISGKVADVFGRRVRVWWLDSGRLLMGVGAGIQLYVFTLTLGFSLSYYIGNNMSWRTLALVGAIPCFIQVLGVFFIPESPRWLSKIGLEKEVEASLQRLRGENADISTEAAEIKDFTETVQQHSGSKFMELFSRKYARPLIVGTGLMALVQFGGSSATSSFASSIFRAAESASRVIAVLQLTSAGACLGCLLAALGFLFEDYHRSAELTSSMVFTGILLFSISSTMGMGGTPWIIMSEILPINIKGSAGSLTTLVNCFTSWIVGYTFNFLFQWNAAGIFFLFAFFCGSVVVFVAMLVPETKGRTLEEIQASMTVLQ
ncbi:putative methyltransferase-like protein 16 -like protein [Capsicum annuum]|nr:putative methyltransferase-like protein 16 -like protein [Capsicum annuum]